MVTNLLGKYINRLHIGTIIVFYWHCLFFVIKLFGHISIQIISRLNSRPLKTLWSFPSPKFPRYLETDLRHLEALTF